MSDACTSRAQTNLHVGRDAEVEALLSARQKIVHGTNLNETRLAAAAPERGTYLRRSDTCHQTAQFGARAVQTVRVAQCMFGD